MADSTSADGKPKSMSTTKPQPEAFLLEMDGVSHSIHKTWDSVATAAQRLGADPAHKIKISPLYRQVELDITVEFQPSSGVSAQFKASSDGAWETGEYPTMAIGKLMESLATQRRPLKVNITTTAEAQREITRIVDEAVRRRLAL